jgi:MoxR-like ATPase
MENLELFFSEGEKLLPGNRTQLRLGFIALALNRNVLIEDVPGMGKTTLVKLFARASGLDFRRIQFTSDLMPADVVGVSIFQKETEQFLFRPGPIFGELILADELNRGTPKAQSALLQAMEEKQVTVDGVTHPLPKKFSIFATQNPRGQFGTFPLPESQLDRFLFKFSMGHLTQEQELSLLSTGQRRDQVNEFARVFGKDELTKWEEAIMGVEASKLLLQYVTTLLHATRGSDAQLGLSPRAGLDLLDAARGWAFLEGRGHVLPDDVQAVFPFVAGHRMFSYQSLPAQTEQLRARDFAARIPFVGGR